MDISRYTTDKEQTLMNYILRIHEHCNRSIRGIPSEWNRTCQSVRLCDDDYHSKCTYAENPFRGDENCFRNVNRWSDTFISRKKFNHNNNYFYGITQFLTIRMSIVGMLKWNSIHSRKAEKIFLGTFDHYKATIDLSIEKYQVRIEKNGTIHAPTKYWIYGNSL